MFIDQIKKRIGDYFTHMMDDDKEYVHICNTYNYDGRKKDMINYIFIFLLSQLAVGWC